jgi:hypothetical protein
MLCSETKLWSTQCRSEVDFEKRKKKKKVRDILLLSNQHKALEWNRKTERGSLIVVFRTRQFMTRWWREQDESLEYFCFS